MGSLQGGLVPVMLGNRRLVDKPKSTPILLPIVLFLVLVLCPRFWTLLRASVVKTSLSVSSVPSCKIPRGWLSISAVKIGIRDYPEIRGKRLSFPSFRVCAD